MSWNPETRIKKLALAYHTGWEYAPGSREAGSVLTDLFVDMMRDNQERYKNIWEKHRQEFLAVIPPQECKEHRLKTGLAVRVSGESHGGRLARKSRVYLAPEEGSPMYFAAQEQIQLTAARLVCAIYQKGLCAWQTYRGSRDGTQDAFGIPLFQAVGTQLCHPVFCWYFQDLCCSKASVRFRVEFDKQPDSESFWEDRILPGSWTISDGTNAYPLEWLQSKDGCVIQGDTPAFAGNLEEIRYELCLEIPGEEELSSVWLEILCGEISFIEEDACREPELCLTAAGACDGKRLLPFTDEPDTAACCYLACDAAGALKGMEAAFRFTEKYQTEENPPPPVPREYRKLYKKYPWLKVSSLNMQEWRVRETMWEYFDGSLWRELPGSREWKIGCRLGESAERLFRWKVPKDIRPCSVEGEEHIYIRLRPVRVDNAYAACYRKEIPVLENFCLEISERRIQPTERKLPDVSEAEQSRMYLGFDREITCDNRWYADSKCVAFSAGQIKGRAERFGREAFWVELECREPIVLSCLYANYVEILELSEEGEPRDFDVKLPMGTVFHVETDRFGVLDAVSVYDGRGTVPWKERQWRRSFPAGFGRVVSVSDINVLVQNRYPPVKVFSCEYIEKDRELAVVLEHSADRRALQKLLPEIGEWLEETLHQTGLLWLSDCRVACMIKDAGFEAVPGEELTKCGREE